jgi:hypothetical protein
VLEDGDVGEAVELGDADAGGELARRALGGNAAAAEAGERRHARVVPAGDDLLGDELEQLALAHHRVGRG